MGNSQVKHAKESSEKYGMVNLSKKHIFCLSESLENLAPTLKSVDLSFNMIKKIPKCVIKFAHLKTLYLQNNNITMIPDEFGGLVNLEKLNMSNNKIKSLPESMSSLVKLKHADFSVNSIEIVQDSILTLPKLTYLNLSNNVLKSVIADLTKSNLIELCLSHNLLKELPETLKDARRLRILRIDHNQLTITSFGSDFMNKTNITVFDYEANLFKFSDLNHLPGFDNVSQRITMNRKKLD